MAENPFAISGLEAVRQPTRALPAMRVIVRAKGDDVRLVHQVAQRFAPGQEPARIVWLKAVVNGVHVYVDGQDIVVTDREILP